MKHSITIIGAGLAGCEAAWQAARRGLPVRLYEMRPLVKTPAHSGGGLAELVCSNSLRGASLANAVGLLKEEMRRLDSLIMAAADATAIPAGGALAVDRQMFSAYIEEALTQQASIELVRQEVTTIPEGPVIIAAGPLASAAISGAIAALTGAEQLFFHDAIAPIISAASIDLHTAFFASRYGKGGGNDYLNCPFTKEQYIRFHTALRTAELFPLRDFEQEKLFAGCMPIEAMARLGEDTMRFGPLKPVGLRIEMRAGLAPKSLILSGSQVLSSDFTVGKSLLGEDRGWNKTDAEFYAVAQLRREDAVGSMYNMVGFQTRLTRAAQEHVFRLIPGLENAEFLRYGAMHRNTYINSPRLLGADLHLKSQPRILFAGQITGIEGYVESAASGLAAGINAARLLSGQSPIIFPPHTAIGSLLRYISSGTGHDFQPMNINFGLLPPLDRHIRNKQEKNLALAERALAELEQWKVQNAQIPGKAYTQ